MASAQSASGGGRATCARGASLGRPVPSRYRRTLAGLVTTARISMRPLHLGRSRRSTPASAGPPRAGGSAFARGYTDRDLRTGILLVAAVGECSLWFVSGKGSLG